MDAITDKEILVVDDDKLALFFVKDCLEEAGFQVQTAQSGSEAWDILTKNVDRFAVVVSDELMPEMSGTMLMEKIKKHPILKCLPVIILSRLNEIKNVLYAVNRGFFEYIIKPADPDELIDLIIDAVEAYKK